MLLKKTKKSRILQVAAALFVAFAFAISFGACEQEEVTGEVPEGTLPIISDFDIGNLVQVQGAVTAVTITPKATKSAGTITIYYEGTDGTTYDKSTTLPSAVGKYAVTFDVAAHGNFAEKTGLSAGTLEITSNIPVAADFDVDGLLVQVEADNTTPQEVTITPKQGKSEGDLTIYYEGIDPTVFEKGTTGPTAKGNYKVTFNVAAKAPFAEATGLEAGTLEVTEHDASKEDPTADDYNITGLTPDYDGTPKAVSIVAKANKSDGAITIHYEGTNGTSYNKTTDAPSAAGSYHVIFSVEATDTYNAGIDLVAGTLVIGKLTPVADDFDFSDEDVTFDGEPKLVSISPENGKSTGTITIYYEGISPTVYTKSQTPPSAIGNYQVTFDVAAADNWNPATGLVAGTLSINAVVEPTTNLVTGPDALGWGVSFTPETLGMQPGTNSEEIRFNWYSANTAANNQTHVRISRGPFTESLHLIEATGTYAAAASGKYQHKVHADGLHPGASYQYSVSNDGTNWSPAYDFTVAPATGAFKFAVVADPQINANVDSGSRYPTSANQNLNGNFYSGGRTTTNGWTETVSQIASKGVSFIATCGDLTDSGNNETQFTGLFNPSQLKNIPFSNVSGNHDNNNNYEYHFNPPNVVNGRNYYYLYNNILFVVLNTGTESASSKSAATTMVNNFRATFTAAKAKYPTYKWLVVQHHKSTASVATHLADRDIQYSVEAGFETLMSEMSVDFVLAGHDHVYARSWPLVGKDNGKVSVPDKTTGVSQDNHAFSNPTGPIYLTFTTASGLKYYQVSSDPYDRWNSSVTSNTEYPYLGTITGANGDEATNYGSSAYTSQKLLPVSTVAFCQPWIPSYTIAEMSEDGKTLTFSTYPIASVSGTTTGAAQGYSFDKDEAYDWVSVTKD